MKKAMTVLGIFISWVPLFLIITDMSHTNSSVPLSWAEFRELPNSGNEPSYWRLAVDSASVDGAEGSDSDKKVEKDGKDDEDQGQIRLWDSILLG